MTVVERNAVERGVVGLCHAVLWLSTVAISRRFRGAPFFQSC